MAKDSFASLMEAQKGGEGDRAKRRLHPGDVIDAVVLQASAEYVYVDVGMPSDGRIPREQLSGESGALRVGPGDRIRVSVVDTGSGLLLKALGQTAPQGAPADEAPKPDEVLKAKVTRVEKFGVFVSTPKGDGLVPIRELGLPPGADHRRMFPPGKELSVVVTDVNAAGKLRFSATQVARGEEANNYREFAQGQKKSGEAGAAEEAPKASFGSLGDVLRSKLGIPEAAPNPGKMQAAAPEKAALTKPEARDPERGTRKSSGGAGGTPKRRRRVP
jgi:ribosomal protein S1